MAYTASGKQILIAAHRGTAGGNIPCNTLVSYNIALQDGADIIELDVSRSLDGELFCFHPGMEPVMYKDPTPIADMPARQVADRLLRNQDRVETVYTTPTLDAAFEMLKNRCIIAVDKYWMFTREIADCIRRHGMQEQVMCKILDLPECYQACARIAPDLPVLPIIANEDRSTDAPYAQGVKFAGVEALFATEDAPIASDSYIEKQHRLGRKLWVNPIVYDRTSILTAGHSDDAAVAGNPGFGWGWLVDKGFDILQTDWTAQLIRYLRERK